MKNPILSHDLGEESHKCYEIAMKMFKKISRNQISRFITSPDKSGFRSECLTSLINTLIYVN